MFFHATVLAHAGFSSNYYGQTNANRPTLPSIAINGNLHTIIDSIAIRSRIRARLAGMGLSDVFQTKRKSILQLNFAIALTPEGKKDEKSMDDDSPAIARAYQYPLALDLGVGKHHPESVKALIDIVCQGFNVGGNHVHNLNLSEPRSMVIRVTKRFTPGYGSYCFEQDGSCPKVVNRLLGRDRERDEHEFYLAGVIVEKMDEKTVQALKEKKVNVYCRVQEAAQAAIEAGLRRANA